MAKIETPENIEKLPQAIIKNIIQLAASGFGLVVALAWNEVIQTTVEEYLDPILGKGGSIVSLLVYALVVTILAVVVTMQLTRIEQKMIKEEKQEKRTELN